MDVERFDRLTKHVSVLTSRRTVLHALTTGSAALAVAMLGIGGRPEAAGGRNNKNKRKRTICHCPINDPNSCITIRVKKKSAKNHLKHHCDYPGPCAPGQVGECTPPVSGCTLDTDCAAGEVCRNRECVQGCRQDGDCGQGFDCRNGGCVCPGGREECGEVCTDLSSDPDNCGACDRVCDSGEVCSNGFTCQGASCLPVTEIENEVKLADNGGLQLIAAVTPGPNPPYVYGALAFGVATGTTIEDLATMESAFDFIAGACGAGTPRFCLLFTNRDDCVCAQFPTSVCGNPGDAGTTGNLIGNNTSGVWFSLCGSTEVVNTYDDAVAAFGGDPIDYIFLVADSSNGTQVVNVEPCISVQ